MIKHFLSEIIIACVILILLFVLVNPTGFFMTTTVEMMLIVGVVLLTGLFIVFVWNEYIHDEREALLRMMADRIGFLSGAGILTIGIIVESLRHNLSDWLLIALGVMIIAKIGGIVYGKLKL